MLPAKAGSHHRGGGSYSRTWPTLPLSHVLRRTMATAPLVVLRLLSERSLLGSYFLADLLPPIQPIARSANWSGGRRRDGPRPVVTTDREGRARGKSVDCGARTSCVERWRQR